ncbi:ion channel [Streptacidiphilus fuscans]|uniref:Ion transporter n=1 Tax=Streptacidiphilus fuscans TaxID=2789292 RepID=A0A931FEW6_9ACTN|nr:ion channel [Streptacidiphilus fuscans]MBF9071013.1 ion transporter [Streptacidiphilus fuscans]
MFDRSSGPQLPEPTEPPSEPTPGPSAPQPGAPEHVKGLTYQGERFERWRRATAVPLLVLGCIFLVLMLLPVLDSELSRDSKLAVLVADSVIWALFCADYTVKLILAQKRKRFFFEHLLDIVLIALPMFRPLGVLRGFGVFAVMARGIRRNRNIKTASYTGAAFVMVLIVGAYGEWLAERNAPGANILTYGDSLWWAIVTAATVGYGDYVPVTTMGKIVASIMMITGVATLSLVTASISSWLVQLSRREDDQVAAAAERQHQLEQFRTLLSEVRQLNERFARLEARSEHEGGQEGGREGGQEGRSDDS